MDRQRYESTDNRDLEGLRALSDFRQALEATQESFAMPLFGLEYEKSKSPGSREHLYGPYKVFVGEFESQLAANLALVRYHEIFCTHWYCKLFLDIEIASDSMRDNDDMDFAASCLHTVRMLCQFIAEMYDHVPVKLDAIKDFVYLIASTPEKHSIHVICHNTDVLVQDLPTHGRLIDQFLCYAAKKECEELEAQISHKRQHPAQTKQQQRPPSRVSIFKFFKSVIETKTYKPVFSRIQDDDDGDGDGDEPMKDSSEPVPNPTHCNNNNNEQW